MKLAFSLVVIYNVLNQNLPPYNGVEFDDNSSIKGVVSVNNIMTPKAFPVKDLTSLPRPHYRVNSINELGTTPKGTGLADFWGTSKSLNIYGPKGDPKLLNQYPWAATTYGQMFPDRYVTISRNYSIKGGQIDPLADAPILKKRLQADNMSCIIELKRNYPYCSMYNGDCQKCTSSDVCVFAFDSAKCVPGTQTGDICGNSKHFAFGVSKCNNSLASGKLFDNIDNLNGQRVKSIRAQIRKRLGATGPWWNEVDDAGKARVVSGAFTNLAPEDFSVREPMYTNKLSTTTSTPADWKPTLNSDYDVISGQVGSLDKGARSLINPSAPTVMNAPDSEPFYTGSLHF